MLDRLDGECGELVLRRTGEHFEVIANGMFLMDTRNGESERLLVTAAAELMPAPGTLLVGGLGVGFSLRAALDHPRAGAVTVVEREAAVIECNLTRTEASGLADVGLYGPSGQMLPELMARLGERPA